MGDPEPSSVLRGYAGGMRARRRWIRHTISVLLATAAVALSACASTPEATVLVETTMAPTWPPALPETGTVEGCIQYSMALFYVEDREQLTEVNCRGMTTLDGVEELVALPNLTTLKLFDNPELKYFAPLAELADHPTLESLWLSNNPYLVDLTPVAELTGLDYLEVSDSPITDLGPLAELTNLDNMALTGLGNLTDIRPLAGLTGLTRLVLSRNAGVTDLTPLAGLTALTELHVTENPGLTDLTPLAGLTKLTALFLIINTALSDLTPLAGLTSLERLYLQGDTALTDVSPLAGLPNLTELALIGSGVQDVGSLSGRENLYIIF